MEGGCAGRRKGRFEGGKRTRRAERGAVPGRKEGAPERRVGRLRGGGGRAGKGRVSGGDRVRFAAGGRGGGGARANGVGRSRRRWRAEVTGCGGGGGGGGGPSDRPGHARRLRAASPDGRGGGGGEAGPGPGAGAGPGVAAGGRASPLLHSDTPRPPRRAAVAPPRVLPDSLRPGLYRGPIHGQGVGGAGEPLRAGRGWKGRGPA